MVSTPAIGEVGLYLEELPSTTKAGTDSEAIHHKAQFANFFMITWDHIRYGRLNHAKNIC